MNSVIKGKYCQQHNEEFIGVDQRCDQNQQCIHYCIECLKNKEKMSNFITYKEANNQLTNNKKKYKNLKEIQINNNIEILKNVASNIQELKFQCNQSFDKILQNVQQQISFLDEKLKQLSFLVEQLDLENFCKKNCDWAKEERNFVEFGNILKTQLYQIIETSKIQNICDHLTNIDNEQIEIKTLSQSQIKTENQKNVKFYFNCPKHNKKIIKVDLKAESQNRLLCDECPFDTIGQELVSVSKFQQQWFNFENKIRQTIEEQEQIMNRKIEVIQELNQKFSTNFEIGDIIHALQSKFDESTNSVNYLSQLSNFSKDWNSLSYEQIIEVAEILSIPNNLDNTNQKIIKNSQNIIQEAIKCIFQNFKQHTQTFLERLHELHELHELHQFQISNNIVDTSYNGHAYYELIESNYIQKEWCYALAINSDQNTLLVGCNEKIKVFKFLNGQIEQTHQLIQHSKYVTCLYYMKKSNKFLSGSDDCSIVIWDLYKNQHWYCEQILTNAHNGCINAILLNINEDLIISCSNDQLIKFWSQKYDWQCAQILKGHEGEVLSLSLNELQNQLVSCGISVPGLFDNSCGQIIINEKGKDQKWSQSQIIKVFEQIVRLCFIDDCTFVYLSSKGGLNIYEKNNERKSYIKQKEIKIVASNEKQCLFPQVYNKQRGVLIIKQGKKVIIIKKRYNGDLTVDQILHFKTDFIFGTITDNGKYLITWEIESQKIEIRQQL